MDDELDELLVEVRAGTSGFAEDMARMRSSFDSTLVDAFGTAGSILERGLLSALRKGSIGFEDLGRMAMQIIDRIAARALSAGLDQIFGGAGGQTGQGGGIAGLLGGAVGAAIGLPGRATGGPVSPGRAYLVGERGPELFVPTSSGRVETGDTGRSSARDVKVSITLAAPRGESAPVAMRRSNRQLASALRRAVA